MKKSKTLKVQDSPQIKKDNKSQLNEIDKKLILKTGSFKKDDNKKSLNTKANTTITDSSKEDKKESTIKKKKSKDKDKFKKQNISVSSKEKVKNKAFDNSDIFYQKKEKKEIKKNKKKKKNSKKKLLKNSLSQRNIGKMKYNDSKTCFDNKISNTVNSSLNRADSSHNILLGTENFVKSLLSKYMDGSDDILNEDLEAFNNNENNEDYEQYSFLEDNIENTTIREPLTLKKNLLSREEKKKCYNMLFCKFKKK
jgi:hypothetical protein